MEIKIKVCILILILACPRSGHSLEAPAFIREPLEVISSKSSTLNTYEPRSGHSLEVPAFIREPLEVISGKSSTLNTYEKICGCNDSSVGNINDIWRPVCQAVKESKLCQNIEAENQLRCTTYRDNKIDIFSLGFLYNCATGLWRSIEEFFGFIKGAITWLYQYGVDSEKRSAANKKFGETYDMVMNYLAVEHEKVKEEGYSDITAAVILSKNILEKVFSAIGELIETSFYQLGCLNREARAEQICKIVNDIFFPPVFAVTLLMKGPSLLHKMSKFSKYFQFNNSIKPGLKIALLASTDNLINAVRKSRKVFKELFNDSHTNELNLFLKTGEQSEMDQLAEIINKLEKKHFEMTPNEYNKALEQTRLAISKKCNL